MEASPSITETTKIVPRGRELSEPTLRVPTGTAEESTSNSGGAQPHQETRAAMDALAAHDGGRPVAVPAHILPLGTLLPEARIFGDCIVRGTIRPHETTRPGLYDCDGPEGRVMVKVAAAEFPPRADLWEKLPLLHHPALLRTFRVGRHESFYAEVQEFCEGGTLEECVPRGDRKPLPWDAIERGIVASFAGGIGYLHQNGIVHRDIKPNNLYLRRHSEHVSLVIGDFDISSLIESDCTSRDTPRGAGTHFYMAPEAFPRFVDPAAGRAAAVVSPASDFYSFGVVLVELLTGTTSLHSGRWADVYDFYMSGGRVEIPADLPDRARLLIQGLLIRNRRTRWGVAEIGRWLHGTNSEEDLSRIRSDSNYELVRRAVRPYNVFASSPSDIPSLARAMQAEPVQAQEELMAGDVLVNWLAELDVRIASEVRRDRELWRHYPRVALTSALMRLDPSLPFNFGPGFSVASSSAFLQLVEGLWRERKVDLASIVSRVNLMRLEVWLRHKTDPEVSLANGVALMRAAWWDKREGDTITPVAAHAAWNELQWALDPRRPFVLGDGKVARTPAELARLCYGQQSDWENGVPSLYRAALDRWRAGLIEGWLRQRTRDESGNVSPVVAQIARLREKETQSPELFWEVVLRLLDPTLPRVPLRLVPLWTVTSGAALYTEVGGSARVKARWEALGPGLPFGAWFLEGSPPQLFIDPADIRTRTGEIEFEFIAGHDIEGGTAGLCHLKLAEGGNCVLPAKLALGYRVGQPDTIRNRTVVAGVLLGAGIAGGARLVAYLMTGPEWRLASSGATFDDDPAPPADTTDIFGQNGDAPPATTTAVNPAAQGNDPPPGYTGALGVMVLGAVVGFYVWLHALRKVGIK